MASIKEPMLAGKCKDMARLKYPLLASYKLDGVRFIVDNGVVLSRTFKPIPNAWVQAAFSKLPQGTDGELIFGDPIHPDAYRNTVSAVMSEDGEPTEVRAHCFDNFTFGGGFGERYGRMSWGEETYQGLKNVVLVPHVTITTVEELEAFEREAVEAGHEGVMVRSLDGSYKQGRSTEREGWLLKIKRFEDAEAVVTGTYEWETNTNAATKNAVGHTERSSHKGGKVGAGVLGGLEVRGLNGTYKDVDFCIGTGFSGAESPSGERGKLWAVRGTLVGRIVRFKYLTTGSKDKPRFPVWLGWRDGRDM